MSVYCLLRLSFSYYNCDFYFELIIMSCLILTLHNFVLVIAIVEIVLCEGCKVMYGVIQM